MNVFLDWLLILSSSLFAWRSYKRLINKNNASIANFIVLIEYVFCCFPILFNYIVGIPKYETIYWYKSFISSMNNPEVSCIYDIYIFISLLGLYFYAKWYDKIKARRKVYKKVRFDGLFNNKIFLWIVILSPFAYIVATGSIMSYLTYATSSARGLTESSYNTRMMMFMLISIYAFCYLFFQENINWKRLVVLLLYSIAIAWVSGKRFIIAIMIILYLFNFTRSGINETQRRNLGHIVPICFLGLIVFSYIYLIVVKPLADFSFQSVYDMLRVDYGRDDVIKYVIEQEFFENNHILEYPGETILSTFLTFIPRAIWTSKPYPHYMYLTASILGTSISKLPAGTTPCWFEMCIANFSWVGFIIGSFTIPLFCYWVDKINFVPYQTLALILLTALITQSMDAYVIILILFIIQFFVRTVFKPRKTLRYMNYKEGTYGKDR